MQYFDVFNGDADGLIARHQYRLSFPLPPERVKLITGCKREIALLSRVDAGADADLSVFDLSYDQNAAAVRGLLDRGASIRYFDHHRASQLRPAPQFEAHIDTSPATCTSLIVDRYLNAAHHTWAIAAAFGDNLTIIAQTLALNAGLSGAKSAALRDLGECLNYNAYGASVTDLFFAPDEIARRMRKFADPFEFMVREDIVARLRSGLAADMRCAESIGAMHA
ncbi:MAG: acetyltransferase, partial [Usitatibacteraceae bacterium]